MKMRRPTAAAASVLLGLAGLSCTKVPIFDVAASFTLADASWFAEEETLFFFYEVSAEQGLGEQSVIEVTYATDDERVPWTDLSALPLVHTHVPVDCGYTSRCGSASLHVPLEPREVAIRLRYHRDGELSLGSDTVFNVVGPGPPHSNRSLVVYGVFDETNRRVQWRSRHRFPTLRNQRAEALGLRRDFTVRGQRFGTAELAGPANPYGYGIDCPPSFMAADISELHTNERAIFNPEDLPLGASDDSTVCADTTVIDATGTFTTNAIARKNPEVRPAFPLLRSPVRDATPIRYFLGPCTRTISSEHEAMQRQRLLLGDLPTTCIDDWSTPGFVDALIENFQDSVEAARTRGNDMVLVIALHQDEPGVTAAVEEALAQVVPEERHRSSPRLAGAFVFDSTIRGLALPELAPVTLWCPAKLLDGDSTVIQDASSRTCAIAPDNPELELGPFSFASLPILPSRERYLDFIDTYSEGRAGRVKTLTFRVPEFAATSRHVDLGEFGVATFLNDELISADADDAFSYCVTEDSQRFVFSSELMASGELAQLLETECESPTAEWAEICASLDYGLMPLSSLAGWHAELGESTYDLGIVWDFPFLTRMTYEVVLAGAVNAFDASLPFGISDSTEAYYGTSMWTEEEFSLAKTLTQCRRFCDHPTFDSAGVYHVTDPFRTTYAEACYQPRYPAVGDSGWPLDP